MKSLKDILANYLGRGPFRDALDAGVVESAWSRAVASLLDKNISNQTQFVSYRREVLKIRVSGSSYRQEVYWRLDELRQIVEQESGKKIKTIVLIQ